MSRQKLHLIKDLVKQHNGFCVKFRFRVLRGMSSYNRHSRLYCKIDAITKLVVLCRNIKA